jgi:hypothetical protein
MHKPSIGDLGFGISDFKDLSAADGCARQASDGKHRHSIVDLELRNF